jgi:hypothetical protein
MCSLTFREEHKLQKFENKALRRIFGPETDEGSEKFRISHNEAMMSWTCDWGWGRQRMCNKFWWMNLLENVQL